MARSEKTKGLLNKYVWVIETISRRGKISFNELNELWQRDIDISGGLELSKRTFDHWKSAIWDFFGIEIVNEMHGEFRYSIENERDLRSNGVSSWLYNTFCVSNALANSQSIKDRILLEHVPSGQNYLKPIIEAMREGRVLNITYHSYNKDEDSNFDVQPYCVKLFRQRWYMVALSTYYNKEGPRIYCLDRIKELNTTDETFKMPRNWDAKTFFRDCYGIISNSDTPIQRIKLKVSAGQANYLRDLKLHSSQQETKRNDEYSIFTYRLRPEYDFIQEILRNGSDVEVLEPQELRKEVAKIIKELHNKYKEK